MSDGLTAYQVALFQQIEQQTAGNKALTAAMILGTGMESSFGNNPSSLSVQGYPDPSFGAPNARSYGPYSMRTSGMPGNYTGGDLDVLLKEGYTRQQAIKIALSPSLSTAFMKQRYQSAERVSYNPQASLAVNAATIATDAEEPATPYIESPRFQSNWAETEKILSTPNIKTAQISTSAFDGSVARDVTQIYGSTHKSSNHADAGGGGSFTQGLQNLMSPRLTGADNISLPLVGNTGIPGPEAWLKILIATGIRLAIFALGIILLYSGIKIIMGKMGIEPPTPTPVPVPV